MDRVFDVNSYYLGNLNLGRAFGDTAKPICNVQFDLSFAADDYYEFYLALLILPINPLRPRPVTISHGSRIASS